ISTSISWSYYGDRAAQYLFGFKSIFWYRLAFVGMHFFGAVVALSTIWAFGDVMLGLMAFFNIIALFALSGKVYQITKSYFSKVHETPDSLFTTAITMDSNRFEQVTLISHPVISRDLTILRDINTHTDSFRSALRRYVIILAYQSLKDLPLKEVTVDTRIQEPAGYDIDQDIVLIPILRAGLGLTDALLQFIPDAKVGHVGMERDETTRRPVDYYANIPDGLEDAMVLVVDPMLATGGSADDALTFMKKEGAQQLRFISLISAPEGLEKINNRHPDVPIITATIDDKLNEDAFIVPGLGDAGDRYFGTT